MLSVKLIVTGLDSGTYTMYTKDAIEQHIKVLESSIETLMYQIKELRTHVNYLQVRAWRKNLRNLRKQLAKDKLKFNSYYGTGHNRHTQQAITQP
jgi:regulator of replication initiation timing